ncbi:MAG: type II secretion system protein [Candidatus Gastranaerophilaceae bacterium]
MIDFKKSVAFTLAETLIVMGIIGVVAALTIPNLNQATGEKEKVARVKKLYSNLEDAIGRTEAIYGPLSEWDTANLTGTVLTGRMSEFMKHSKECSSSFSGCFASSISAYSSSGTAPDVANNAASFVTADGSSVGVVDSGNLIVYIDIDGPNKGENKVGKDVFQFYLNSPDYLLTPAGRGSYDTDVTDCTTNSNCTGWVVDYDNLDYTKTGSDGKTCSTGSVVLNSSKTSCK